MDKPATQYCCGKAFSWGLASHRRSKRCELNKGVKLPKSQCHICKGEFGPGGLKNHMEWCENQRREHSHLRPAGRYADVTEQKTYAVAGGASSTPPTNTHLTRDNEGHHLEQRETDHAEEGGGSVVRDVGMRHSGEDPIDVQVHSQGVGMLVGGLPDAETAPSLEWE
jgi:hypothetical protein